MDTERYRKGGMVTDGRGETMRADEVADYWEANAELWASQARRGLATP